MPTAAPAASGIAPDRARGLALPGIRRRLVPASPPPEPPDPPQRPGAASGSAIDPLPEPPAEPAARIELDMTPEGLSDLRRRVREAAAACAPDAPPVADDAETAVDEALQNVLRHAYCGRLPARVELIIWVADGHLWVRLRDYAEPVDLSRIRPRPWNAAEPGGMGVRLIAAVMDRVRYAHAPDGRGNVLTMGRRLDRQASEGNRDGG